MHPTTVFCPHLACPARGQAGQGHIGIHARQEKRFICPEGWKTFTTTQGPAVYRLRTSSETATRVVTLLAHGCPRPALVVAFGCEERTVADGLRRAGVKRTPALAAGITDHGWTIQELLVLPVPSPRWSPPKRRGRPSRALPHLIARWCA
jgi:transposase-like protein